MCILNFQLSNFHKSVNGCALSTWWNLICITKSSSCEKNTFFVVLISYSQVSVVLVGYCIIVQVVCESSTPQGTHINGNFCLERKSYTDKMKTFQILSSTVQSWCGSLPPYFNSHIEKYYLYVLCVDLKSKYVCTYDWSIKELSWLPSILYSIQYMYWPKFYLQLMKFIWILVHFCGRTNWNKY